MFFPRKGDIMKRVICVFSIAPNGALTQSFFKKSFPVTSAPPPIDTMITIGCLLTHPSDWNRLKEGAVTDVNIRRSTQRVWVEFKGTEMSTEDLRGCLTPAEKWEEISGEVG